MSYEKQELQPNYKTFAAAKSAYADYRDKADKWKERYSENAQKREESIYSRLQNYQRESTYRQTKQSSKNMGRGER